jgi:hypothetical protein
VPGLVTFFEPESGERPVLCILHIPFSVVCYPGALSIESSDGKNDFAENFQRALKSNPKQTFRHFVTIPCNL